MINWKEFFDKYLIQTGFYKIEESTRLGDTDMETYSNINQSNQTCIKTGYLQNGELIYCVITHPNTIGFNKYQEQEYFYRFDFTPGESYGSPGLEFNDINQQAIFDLLKNGLKGREEQYFRGDKLVKAVVYKSFGDDESSEFGTTIWFEKQGLIQKLKKYFSDQKIDLDKKVIMLETIFNGINI